MRRKFTDQTVWDAAHDRARTVFELFDTVVVLFSGGKDSTATLHVVMNVAEEVGWPKPVVVVHYDEEAVPYQTEQYLRRVAAAYGERIELRWLCLPVEHRNACSRTEPWWYPWAPEDRHRWVRELPPEAVTEVDWADFSPGNRPTTVDATPMMFADAARYGRVALCFGIRTAESLRRFRALTQKAQDNYLVGPLGPGHNCYNVYPIYDWTAEDVWTAPRTFGWDYNRAYDAMDKAGMSAHNQRCSPPFGEEPLERLWTYHVCFPEIWDAMTRRVEGAATAARYARTELWGYRHDPRPPPGTSWQDYIAQLVARWRQPERRQVARSVRRLINEHYHKTSQPVLEAAHPLTGVSWPYLAKIALRGDLKGRKTPSLTKGEDAAAWAAYDSELAKYRATRETEP